MGSENMSEARIQETKDAYQHAKAAYEQIKSEHESAVSQCKEALGEAKKSQKKTITALNRQIASLENDLHGKVASAGNVSLYHDRLETGNTTYRLEHGLRVSVSTSGSKYSTTEVSGGGVSVGGAVVGAAIAGVPGAVIGGRKKVKSKEVVHDDRHLYITIESPHGGQVVDLNPELEPLARSLAAKVPGCINLYQGLIQDIPPKIKALKEQVAQAENDPAVSAAQGELQRVTNNTERLEAAKQARDDAKQLYHDVKKQAKSPLFGSRSQSDHDDADQPQNPSDNVPVSKVEQERPASPTKPESKEKSKNFSGILWKILGIVVIALGVFFLLATLGGILDGYDIPFILVCLVLGCGLVYLGIRLMKRKKVES